MYVTAKSFLRNNYWWSTCEDLFYLCAVVFLLLFVQIFFFFVNSILTTVLTWIHIITLSLGKRFVVQMRSKGTHGRPFTQLRWSNTRINNALQKCNTKVSVNLPPNLMWQSRPLLRLVRERLGNIRSECPK